MNQWVRLQRSNEKRGLLSLERKKKLDSIGFPWVVPPAGARYAVYGNNGVLTNVKSDDGSGSPESPSLASDVEQVSASGGSSPVSNTETMVTIKREKNAEALPGIQSLSSIAESASVLANMKESN